MPDSTVLKILERVGAIHTDGHFVYTSGRHGRAYINKDALYPHTHAVQQVCEIMAAPFHKAAIDIVAGPTLGGIILSQWVAENLSTAEHEVLAIFAEEERTEDGTRRRFFGRGYDALVAGKKVLIVEDIITTGGSVKRVVDAVAMAGGTTHAVVAICNRGGISAHNLGVERLESLVTLDCESWPTQECPLCQKGIAVSTTLGKGGRGERE
jgi:orotate phosphoribosyltransferase